MNSATINIKVDPQTKKQAQKIADDIGFSLSGILNAYLKEFIRTRSIHIELPKEAELTDYAKSMLAISQKELKEGTYLAFESPQAGFDYLENIFKENEKGQQ